MIYKLFKNSRDLYNIQQKKTFVLSIKTDLHNLCIIFPNVKFNFTANITKTVILSQVLINVLYASYSLYDFSEKKILMKKKYVLSAKKKPNLYIRSVLILDRNLYSIQFLPYYGLTQYINKEYIQ